MTTLLWAGVGLVWPQPRSHVAVVVRFLGYAASSQKIDNAIQIHPLGELSVSSCGCAADALGVVYW